MIGKRRAEWSSMSRTKLVAIVTPLWNVEPSKPAVEDPWQQTEWILTRHFNLAVDRRLSPKKRRASWHYVNTLLKLLDKSSSGSSSANSTHQSNNAINSKQQQQQKTAQEPARSGISTSPQKQTTKPVSNQSSSSGKKQAEASKVSALVDKQNSGASTKITAAATTLEAPPQPQQQRKQPPVTGQQEVSGTAQSRPVTLSSKPSTSASAVPTRATPTPPTSTAEVVQRPSPASKQNIGSAMGSAFSSTAKIVPTTATAPKKHPPAPPPPLKKPVPPPPPRPPAVPVSINFGADTNRFAGAIDKGGRSSLRVTFQQRPITLEESQRTLSRLQTFDPYWKVEHLVGMAETFPINRLENFKTGTKPLQAAECEIKLDAQSAMKVREWGKAFPKGSKRYAHGEMRLLVRMLPVRPIQKKRPRADTHLWPKGTFVQMAGCPIAIDQRRQQSHDPREWKSMSTPLDLTPKLADPRRTNKLQMYFLDNEPYILCVAICSYVAPDVLNRVIWHDNWIKKLTPEEAKAKALENANRQTVVLDGDNTDSSSKEVSSFIFPLSCPISQQLIKTPVRGQNCNHWQCFDLKNFVESNSHTTGTRWECPVCARILSLRDLEYCPLTASILQEFESTATPHRDRVQLFANYTWKLLDEAKKRYSKKRSAVSENMNGNKRPRTDGVTQRPMTGSPEVIDLL